MRLASLVQRSHQPPARHDTTLPLGMSGFQRQVTKWSKRNHRAPGPRSNRPLAHLTVSGNNLVPTAAPYTEIARPAIVFPSAIAEANRKRPLELRGRKSSEKPIENLANDSFFPRLLRLWRSVSWRSPDCRLGLRLRRPHRICRWA